MSQIEEENVSETMLTSRIPNDLNDRVTEAARDEGLSRSAFVRDALRRRVLVTEGLRSSNGASSN